MQNFEHKNENSIQNTRKYKIHNAKMKRLFALLAGIYRCYSNKQRAQSCVHLDTSRVAEKCVKSNLLFSNNDIGFHTC